MGPGMFDGLGSFIVTVMIVAFLLGCGVMKGCEAIEAHIGHPTIGWSK